MLLYCLNAQYYEILKSYAITVLQIIVVHDIDWLAASQQ